MWLYPASPGVSGAPAALAAGVCTSPSRPAGTALGPPEPLGMKVQPVLSEELGQRLGGAGAAAGAAQTDLVPSSEIVQCPQPCPSSLQLPFGIPACVLGSRGSTGSEPWLAQGSHLTELH